MTLLQILLYPLHRLNHILAMAEGRQPEATFPARTETGTRRAGHVAFIEGFVEERKSHVSARRNSINKHLKSQPTIPFTPRRVKNLSLTEARRHGGSQNQELFMFTSVFPGFPLCLRDSVRVTCFRLFEFAVQSKAYLSQRHEDTEEVKIRDFDVYPKNFKLISWFSLCLRAFVRDNEVA